MKRMFSRRRGREVNRRRQLRSEKFFYPLFLLNSRRVDRILRWLGLRKERKRNVDVLREAGVVEPARQDLRKREVSRTETRKRATGRKKTRKAGKTKKEMVVSYLKRRKKPATVEEVASKVGITIQTARRYLYYLAKEGKVEKKGKGWVAR